MPYKFIGKNGRRVAGMPARDIADDEVPNAIRAEFHEQCKAGDTEDGPTPVYAVMTKTEAKAFENARKAEAEATDARQVRRAGHMQPAAAASDTPAEEEG